MASSAHATVVTGRDLKTTKHVPMTRPGYGRLGRTVTLQTNFFKLAAPRLEWIYQYCLFIDAMRAPEGGERSNGYRRDQGRSQELTDITPSAYIGFIRNVLRTWWSKHLPDIRYAHDGRKTIYTPVELPVGLESADDEPGDRQFAMEVDSEGNISANPVGAVEKVYVRIRKVSVIDCRSLTKNASMNTYESASVIAAIDTVLAAGPVHTHVQVGRSFYHHSEAERLPSGAEAWRGFYQSARRSMIGVLVNMDESRTPFWSSGGRALAELIDEMQLNVYGSPADKKRAAKMLSGLKVRSKHNMITYRVHGFSQKSAFEETFFDQQANATVSVANYFYQKYGVTLRDQDACCVLTHPKKKTLVPLEVLIVLHNQRLSKAMSPEQTSKMIKVAATRPNNRATGAVKAIKKVNHNDDPTCQAFGIKVDQQLLQVRARILPPPKMIYSNRASDNPRGGVWNNQHRLPLYKCAPVNTWCVLNLTRAPEHAVRGFVDKLVGEAASMKMEMYRDPKIFSAQEHRVEDKLFDITRIYNDPRNKINGWPLQLVLIVKFKQDTQVYNAIKRIADIEMGVASQVMLSKHLQPRQRTYYGNLLLKINAKLGGSNFIPVANNVPDVPFAKQRHIVLGADVTHPAGGGNRPSVAALVGSRNQEVTQFTGSLRNMPPRQELMTEMGDMFREVYNRWLNNWPPNDRQHASAIIMFRDGVSEGQFEQVMETELEALRRACTRYHPQWNPKITYIIVTKRHHARFFPTSAQDADRSGNCPPGTVVDTDIMSQEFYDFYLNSHAGIQGTSRPSKYTVLVDENKISVDALQSYVYRLAHAYARCNRSVSIASPAYYSHLLAFRGRAYLNEDGSDSASTATNDSAVPPTVNLHEKLGKRLFFV